MRPLAVSWLVVACGTLLAGCGGEPGAPSLPSVGDPKTLSADAAKLAADLAPAVGERIIVSRKGGEGDSATYATLDGDRPVTLSQSMLDLEPREIAVVTGLVVLNVRLGDGATHHGTCVFLEEAEQNRIDKAVAEFKLKEIDRAARVYEFNLGSYMLLVDSWSPLP